MSMARRAQVLQLSSFALACALFACSEDDNTPSRVTPDPVTAGHSGSAEAGSSVAGTSGGKAGAAGGAGMAGSAGTTMRPPPSPPSPPPPNADLILKSRCATSTVLSQLLPSNLLIVLDRSASMACNPPPLTDSPSCEADPVRENDIALSKWEITREALKRAISKLPTDTVVGLAYFSNDDSCGVHSSPSVPLSPLDPRQISTLRASLDNVTPNGATPLVGATVLAYKHLHSAALAGEIHGSKYVVLITDGEQSDICSDNELCANAAECTRLLLEDEVPRAAAAGVGIKTFVIGAPGSEPARSVLSAIAKAGGTAPEGCNVAAGNCHFDMTRQESFDEGHLQDALSEIAGRALSCELPLPEPADGSVELERLNVIFSPADGSQPTVIQQDARHACGAGADGWQYAEGAAKILLCGATCDRVLADRGGRLDVVLGCPVQIVM